jgi:phosphatidylglycerol lysyltransferase
MRLARRFLPPLIGLAMFVLALAVLHRELAHLRLEDVREQLDGIPLGLVLAATVLTALSFLVLTRYDALSLRYLGRRLEDRRSSLASFLGYAISQNVGLTLISGAPIRYRLYTTWGLSAVEVATVVAFNGLTFWLGMLAVGGVAFTVAGGQVPASLHLGWLSLRPVGLLFLAGVLAYLAACRWIRHPLRLGRWELRPPSMRIALGQLALSSLDWTVSASVLWVLLRPVLDVGFPHLLVLFLLAQIAGLLSQVPAGLGVFESVILSLLPVGADASGVLASLVAYRLVYYLLPLAIAAMLLLGYEVAARRREVAMVSGFAAAALEVVAPGLLAFITFVGGAVLLVSGATPAESSRLRWLSDIVPLPALELSHFLASVVGVLLLLLAWGLRRRLAGAWVLTVAMLAAGVVLSLLKGGDYEEAAALGAMILVLAPARRVFYRSAPLLSEPLSPRWIAAVAMVLAGATWIGFFAHRHLAYSADLWWSFSLHGDASRFLRAEVGVAVCLLALGLARLLGHSRPTGAEPSAADLDRARSLVAACPRASANLALLGDKRFVFSSSGRSMIMYAVQRRSWVAMGDPVGPRDERRDLVWAFHALADRHGGWTVLYEVGEESLHLYLELGLTALKIGEDASVPLRDFSLDGRDRKELRYALRRQERDGCTFEIVGSDAVPAMLDELRSISDAWLTDKHSREKGFSMGRFDAGYLSRFAAAVVRQHGRIVAFANLWCGAPGGELSIDLMRHLPEAPAGVMDYLFVELMLWGRDHGFSSFDLGMAPLAGFRAGPFSTLWSRLAALAYQHGEYFYNFQGLRHYKDKFDPEWRPRYIVCPPGRAVPGVLADLAALISGGLLGAVRK